MISLAGFSKESGFSPLLESVICAFSAGRLVYTLGYMSDTSFILELQFSCILFFMLAQWMLQVIVDTSLQDGFFFSPLLTLQILEEAQ